MTHPRILAAFVVILTLLGVTAFAATLEPPEETAPVVVAPPTTTTTAPDFEVLVESNSLDPFAEAESDLTDEAIYRSTSTTTSTTTTTTTTAPPATTATTAASSGKAKSSPTTSPPTTKASAQAGYLSSAESDFASKINSYRSANGMASLKRDSSLNSYARSWAKKMGQSGNLSHSNIASLLPPWSSAGENVGTGGSVKAIFGALESSSGHRANMLGDFTHFGVGVWRDGSGVLWTAHVFTR
ncbi:MAG: CAP domain-containing protein [Acidimicrobiia bacterium]